MAARENSGWAIQACSVAGSDEFVSRTTPSEGCQCVAIFLYMSPGSSEGNNRASWCSLYPGVRWRRRAGRIEDKEPNTLSHWRGSRPVRAAAVRRRKGRGVWRSEFHKRPPHVYRLYPPKTSSPPSPDRLTVTCCRVS